jgi:predicted nuclease with TOPRIM domain
MTHVSQDPPPARRYAARDPAEVARHEAHLVGMIYHLIEANQKLEEQVDRLGKVTEIAELFREKRLTRDTFALAPPRLTVPNDAQQAWTRIEKLLGQLSGDAALVAQLREALGVVRAGGWQSDPDWLADVRGRLIAAEQAIAFLDEQSRELDMLRREKDGIVDGAARLEQNIDDLWKALNEKTTHIQRLEGQLQRIWSSRPYRLLDVLRRSLRREAKP